MKAPRRKNRGFTLIELLVVISIIGLLSSVVLAALSSARAKGVIGAGQTFDDHLYHAFGANASLTMNFDDKSNSNSTQGDTVSDVSGNSNNGTLYGSTVVGGWTTGISGSALTFNGTDNYVYVTNPKGLPSSPSTNYSISLWVKPAVLSGRQIMVSWGNGGNDHSTLFESSGTTLGLDQYGDEQLSSKSVVNAGVWNQVTMSFSSGSVNFYVNGKFTETLNMHSAMPDVTNIAIGACSPIICGSAVLFFNGVIDSVRIYSQSLQVGQVEKLYAQSAAKHGIALN